MKSPNREAPSKPAQPIPAVQAFGVQTDPEPKLKSPLPQYTPPLERLPQSAVPIPSSNPYRSGVSTTATVAAPIGSVRVEDVTKSVVDRQTGR